MKHLNLKVILFSLIIFSSYTAVYAQPGLTFEYDEAGNQTVREWVCISCTQQELNSVPEEINRSLNNLAKEDDLSVVRNISTYPNPVEESLKVEWKTNDELSVKFIQVYSLNGAVTFRGEYTSIDRSTVIPFLNMEKGYYVLRVTYLDGKRQSIKIMKK